MWINYPQLIEESTEDLRVILCALFGAACSGRQGPADDAREHVSVEDFTYSLLPVNKIGIR